VADPFVDFVVAQLGGCEGLSCVAMFGGHGLYQGRTLVGIVSHGRLYVKADAATAADCGQRGARPYRADHEVLRTFFEVPADVLMDRERIARWARAASRLDHGPRRYFGAGQADSQAGPVTSRPGRSTSW
jgi:DNA transformation protein and related proteins